MDQDMSHYQIYAIQYAKNQNRRSSSCFLGGDTHDRPMPMDFFIWALVSDERTILVDTGFDAESAAKRGREISRPIAEGLGQIGIAPEAVENVVLTHMHWDHAGNHDMFSNAKYHIQSKEMQYCTGRCMCHATLRSTYDVEDVSAMVRKVFTGRAKFHEGSTDLFPGVSLHLVGGHTMGLQVVRVRTNRGWVVIASDAAHYYANFLERRPFPIMHNVEDMLQGFDTLEALAESRDHIIPGHDPKVLERYPAARNDIRGIVRLDLPPER